MLWHRIAYDWGCTVSELQERMTSAEFTQLCAYLRKEPHGYEIENYRSGVIAATVANVVPRKKGAKPLKPQDFYPLVGDGGPKSSARLVKQLREKRAREAKARR